MSNLVMRLRMRREGLYRVMVESAGKVKRLSLKVTHETQATFQRMAEKNGTTITEAVRRMAALMEVVMTAQEQGKTILLRDPDGTVTELLIL